MQSKCHIYYIIHKETKVHLKGESSRNMTSHGMFQRTKHLIEYLFTKTYLLLFC